MASKTEETRESESKKDSSGTMLYTEEYKPPFLAVLVLVFPILPLFWKYHVSIDEKKVSFGYSSSMTSKSADRSEVVNAKSCEIRPLQHFGGWGIRLRLGKLSQTGYIAKGGPGVEITLKNVKSKKESVYVFSCHDPEKVCSILNEHIAAKR